MEGTKHTVRAQRRGGDVDHTRRNLLGLGIGLGLTLAVVLTTFLVEKYQTFELAFLDLRFRFREQVAPIARTSRLVHVDIDDQSVLKLGRWPWSRKVQATFVSTLSALGPRAIVYDVEFPDPVPPIFDPILVEQNLAGVLEAQKMGVDKLPEEVALRVQAFLDRAADGKVDAEGVLDLQRNVRELGREVASSRDALLHAIEKARVDDDDVFAAAIARSRVVYLPCSFEPETGWFAEPDLIRALVDLLSKDLLLDAQALADRLGLVRADIPPSLHVLKEKVAYDRALKAFIVDPETTDDAIWKSLCPGTDQPVSTMSLPEGDVVRHACRMARGVGAQRVKIRIHPKGETIAERIAVRRIFAPVPPLARAGRSGGFVSVDADPLDGKLRRLKLVWEAHGEWYPQHMLRVAMDVEDIPPDGVEFADGPSMVLRPREGAPIVVPLDEDGRVIMNWIAGEFEQNYFGRHLPFARIIELARRVVEAGRILEQCATRRSITVDMTGWEESLAAFAPGEVLDPKPTDLSPAKGFARVKEVEQAMIQAIGAEKKAVDEEIAGLDAETQGRTYHKFLLEKQRELSSALTDAGKHIAHAAALEAELQVTVAGKVCMIGSSQWGGTDFKPTPLNPHCPGVALHSNLFNMIENGSFIRRARPLTNAGIVIFVGLFVTLVSIRTSSVRAGLRSLGILVLYLLLGFWAFMAHGFWIDFLGPIAATILCWGCIATFKEAMEAKNRRQVETLWGQYVSPTVVEMLLKNPELQKIFAERRIVTMLFSDVAGFTKESERLDAETVSNLINVYLDEMSQPIDTYDGYLNKYEGDAIMAFWGAPIAQPDQAVRGCFAALDMQAKLHEIQRGFKEKGLPMMHTRIGVNTGLVFVGNFGSKRKFDYTAIGDHVNLASRLEGANKAFGTGIMIADATYQAAKEFVEVRRLGKIRVVGRDTPVGIYELLARTGELTKEQKEMCETFHDGLAAFEKREWQNATERFRRVLEIVPEDGPAKVYIRLVAEHRTMELPPGWDGVITLESK
ncbi:MAG: adenylate/guanylate cyclase domain-containing protein [Planctomycetota bacterium]